MEEQEGPNDQSWPQKIVAKCILYYQSWIGVVSQKIKTKYILGKMLSQTFDTLCEINRQYFSNYNLNAKKSVLIGTGHSESFQFMWIVDHFQSIVAKGVKNVQN